MITRWQERERTRDDLAYAWALVWRLRGVLERLPERRLGQLVDLRDLLEKLNGPVTPKRESGARDVRR